MKYPQLWKIIVVTVMALTIMPMASGIAFAGSGSGISSDDPLPRASDKAEIFLGFGACPGGPCADVKLNLGGGTLNANARGFGFPLDPDGTDRLNRYALCVDDIFVGDDEVDSKDRRVVEDDGEVSISDEASVNFTGLLGAVVTIVDIGDNSPANGSRDASCVTGSVLLVGVVEFRNLR